MEVAGLKITEVPYDYVVTVDGDVDSLLLIQVYSVFV